MIPTLEEVAHKLDIPRLPPGYKPTFDQPAGTLLAKPHFLYNVLTLLRAGQIERDALCLMVRRNRLKQALQRLDKLQSNGRTRNQD